MGARCKECVDVTRFTFCLRMNHFLRICCCPWKEVHPAPARNGLVSGSHGASQADKHTKKRPTNSCKGDNHPKS